MTTPALLTLLLGVTEIEVAPGAMFLAYQISTTVPTVVSVARAAPASAYAFSALSVMVVIVVEVLEPPGICQPTTSKFPLPVAGIVQLVPGKVSEPQEVTWTRLIWLQSEPEPKARAAKRTIQRVAFELPRARED